MGAWVYSDAKARGAAQPALWGIGTVLVGIIVFPLWLIVRPVKTAVADGAGRPALQRAGLSRGFKIVMLILGGFIGLIVLGRSLLQ